MKHSATTYALAFISLSLICTGCYYNTPVEPEFNVTQEQLDNATILSAPQDTTILGDPFNAFGSDTVTTKHKLRDMFANIELPNDITVGTIMIRRAYYYRESRGIRRDSLLNIVVMVKREGGYYPEGGDWEYIDIKYNKNTNYKNNPNGVLPVLINDVTRGRIPKCATCHARAESKFLFHGN